MSFLPFGEVSWCFLESMTRMVEALGDESFIRLWSYSMVVNSSHCFTVGWNERNGRVFRVESTIVEDLPP